MSVNGAFGLRLFVAGILTFLVGSRCEAEGQLTLVNVNTKVSFKSYALKVNEFRYAPGDKRDDMDILRICESIDNSRLVVMGMTGPAKFRETTAFLFGTPAVAASVDAFFKRGGMMYFESGSWSVYNSWAGEARRFFSARGVALPDGSCYVNPSRKQDVNIDGMVCGQGDGRLFGKPRDPGQLRSIRYFGGVVSTNCEAYVSAADGRPLMVGRRIDKGRVVFSLVYSVQRTRESPFWDNVVESLYGKDAVRKNTGRNIYLADAKSRGKTGLFIREESVFTQRYADSPLPDGGVELSHIDMLLARGERELAEIVFYNCSEENLVFRLEPESGNPSGDMFRFLDVLPRRTEDGRVQNEIVIPLNAAGCVFVPSGETKLLLLAAKATHQLPGRHDWSFTLVPVNAEREPHRITVSAEVLNLEMSGKKPDIYLFGPYGMTWAKGKLAGYQEFLANEYHINHFMIQKDIWKRVLSVDSAGKIVISDNDADYMTDEVRMQRLGWKWIYGYGMMDGFSERLKELGRKVDFSDHVTLELLDRAVARWVAALKSNGIDLGNCYEPVRDEPNSKMLDDFIAIARTLRRHGLKVAVDIATWCTLDDVRRLAPVVDMWEPWEPRVTVRDTAAEELSIYKTSGKPILPYLCSTSGNTAPYLDYHRFRGIRTFLLGADGFCTWAANSWRGNDYRGSENALGGTKGSAPGAFYVHHGDTGPVATMRLEAFREGIEDLYWLNRAVNSGCAAEFCSEKCLNGLLSKKDAAAVRVWRNALLRTLENGEP